MSALLAAAIGLPFLIGISVTVYAAVTSGRARRANIPHQSRRDAGHIPAKAIGDRDV